MIDRLAQFLREHGVIGPDRTASTPTETPASPTRTASTPVPSPTATDAPGTAAATAPPAVSGSAETDREALVAFYNATNGKNWFENDNWLSDAPLGEWKGVTTNGDGRVTVLYLNNNALRSGEIPAELGSLSNLTELDLHSNRLSGEICQGRRENVPVGRSKTVPLNATL